MARLRWVRAATGCLSSLAFFTTASASVSRFLAASNSSRSKSSIACRLRSSTLRTDFVSCASASGAHSHTTTARALAPKDDKLHPPVLGASLVGAVVGDRHVLSEPARLHPRRVDSLAGEVLLHRLGALLRQPQVELGVAAAVGVPLDPHPDRRVVGERRGHLVEQR